MRNPILVASFAVSVLFSFTASAACTFGFLSEYTEPAGLNPYNITSGDFNHDGLDDLAVANGQSSTIAILLAEQGGTYAAPVLVSTGGDPKDVVAAYMNGDEHLDLVAVGGAANGGSGGSRVVVLLGDGNGGFTRGDEELMSYPEEFAAGDFDNDGDIDIAANRNHLNPAGFNLLLNAGGVLTQKSINDVGGEPNAGSFVEGITAGDFDSDGNLDVALADHHSDRVWIYFGAGDGTFTRSASGITTTTGVYQDAFSVAAGDFNGDGHDDVAVGHRDPYGYGGVTFAMLLSNGASRSFAAPVEIGNMSGQGAWEIRAHDLNADGNLDVAIAHFSHTYVFLGNGNGTFAAQQTFGGGGLALTVLDVDNDGGADIATSKFTDDTVGILRNICGQVTLDLSSSANPGTKGTPVTITASITANPAATGTLTITQTGGGVIATTNLAASTTTSATLSLEIGTYEFIATYSGDSRFPAASRTITQTVVAPPFGPPPGFNVTSAGSVPELSWIATEGTYQYEVFRNTGAGYDLIATTPSPSYIDMSLPAYTAVLYKVRAISPSLVASAFSAPDFTTTHIYTDPTVVALVHVAKRAHLTELRNAADAVRLLAGLPLATWTDPVPTVIRAVHINELRTAINQARAAIGIAPSSFTDPTTGTTTLIRAAHINEARAALR